MKKIIYAPSVKDVKNIHSAGIRSIPKAQRSMYLDLFILAKERERLEKERFMVSRRNRSLGRQLGLLNRRIGALQETLLCEHQARATEHEPMKNMKKMPIRY